MIDLLETGWQFLYALLFALGIIVVGWLTLEFDVLPKAFEVIKGVLELVLGLIVFLSLYLPLGVLRWLVHLPGRLRELYYQLNPAALKAKERRASAELLITYEEKLKKRDALAKILEDQSNLLYRLSQKIDSLESDVFNARFKGHSAASVFESYDPTPLMKYEEIKAVAVLQEKTLFELFIVRQKLKLYGIDRGLKQSDE